MDIFLEFKGVNVKRRYLLHIVLYGKIMLCKFEIYSLCCCWLHLSDLWQVLLAGWCAVCKTFPQMALRSLFLSSLFLSFRLIPTWGNEPDFDSRMRPGQSKLSCCTFLFLYSASEVFLLDIVFIALCMSEFFILISTPKIRYCQCCIW
jgi:hypothetical protein